jgi:cytochrome P450
LLIGSSINGNAYKHLFWVLSYIFFDSKLHAAVRAEVEPAVAAGLDGLDSRLEKCPLLLSTYEETLRINTSSVTVRDVMADTKIGNKILRKGAKVFAPTRQLHFDPLVFGKNVNHFDSERFLRNEGLNKSNSYRPFGGGITHCPGRWLAMKEILLCVALVLSRFDVKLLDAESGSEAQAFPKVDTTMLALGVLPPLKGEDVHLVLTKK